MSLECMNKFHTQSSLFLFDLYAVLLQVRKRTKGFDLCIVLLNSKVKGCRVHALIQTSLSSKPSHVCRQCLITHMISGTVYMDGSVKANQKLGAVEKFISF